MSAALLALKSTHLSVFRLLLSILIFHWPWGVWSRFVALTSGYVWWKGGMTPGTYKKNATGDAGHKCSIIVSKKNKQRKQQKESTRINRFLPDPIDIPWHTSILANILASQNHQTSSLYNYLIKSLLCLQLGLISVPYRAHFKVNTCCLF